MQTISGTLWHDANYNGLLDAGEEPLSGIEVYLKVWIWNDVANKWVRYIPNEGPADPDGIVNDKPVNTTATMRPTTASAAIPSSATVIPMLRATTGAKRSAHPQPPGL